MSKEYEIDFSPDPAEKPEFVPEGVGIEVFQSKERNYIKGFYSV